MTMHSQEDFSRLKERIEELEIRIKHLSNELRLSKTEYQDASRRYFDIHAFMEKIIDERTRQLRTSEEKYRLLVENSPLGIFHYDGEGIITFCNGKLSTIWGLDRTEILHGNIFESHLSPKAINALLASLSGKTVQFEGSLFPGTRGQYPMVKMIVGPYLNEEGASLSGGVGIVEDISDLKRIESLQKNTEARLRQAQKMEALGTLAGGVAHDLNNIISSAISYPEILLMEIPLDSALRGPIEKIQQSGMKAAAIVQDLLTLARRGVPITDVVNLKDIIEDYLNSPVFEKLSSFHPLVRIRTEIESPLLNIIGSSLHLSKVVMNLVSNAAEAITQDGEILIKAENRFLDMPLQSNETMTPGDYVVLTIRDTGTGISREDLNKIFDPFYTKKKMGRSGTGLGMAVVLGTVKDHDGFIDIDSEETRGTTVTLYFPATREETKQAEVQPKQEIHQGQGETILVVDDKADQREIAETLLTRLGYRVKTAAEGKAAVEYLKTQPVDLVLLDMIMDPDIDGLETLQSMLAVRPKQKAILVSGFSETERVKVGLDLGAGDFIRKPYLLNRLGRAIRTVLDKN